jgi:polyisoprenoid-binding protein YceI
VNQLENFVLKTGRQIALNAALAAALSAVPAARAVEFNQLLVNKSTVGFVFKQMNVPIEGSFKRFKGELSFDPAKPEAAKTTIEIDLASIDAGFPEASDEAAGKLWFDTRTYPAARFVSTSIRPLGNNRFDVAGRMSIKGRTLDARTPVTFSQTGNSGVFEGSFILKRADYGIGEGMWADFGTVANEVQIKFRVVASAGPARK